MDGLSVGDNVGDGVGGAVGVDEGATTGESVGLNDGVRVGTADGTIDGRTVGMRLGVALGKYDGLNDGKKDGLRLGNVDGILDGSNDGCKLGVKLGSSDGTALLQVSQHIFNTVFNLHLCHGSSLSGSSSAAHAQSCTAPPSSGILNEVSPAASPVQELQQVSQQFLATSGSAHLNFVCRGSLAAQMQLCFATMPEMENFAVVASPIQPEGHDGGNDSATTGVLIHF